MITPIRMIAIYIYIYIYIYILKRKREECIYVYIVTFVLIPMAKILKEPSTITDIISIFYPESPFLQIFRHDLNRFNFKKNSR